jgi:holo-[acyl-carrier protein] synthase
MSDIIGIGIDLIDLDHFGVNYGKGDPELLARCFTDMEIADSGDGHSRTAHLAARFAAKEATFKALGGASNMALTDVELIHGQSGQPELRLHGVAKEAAERRGAVRFLVSLTHSASAAAAVVIVLSGGPK